MNVKAGQQNATILYTGIMSDNLYKPDNKSSLFSRVFAMIYALFAYVVASFALFWFFFATLDWAPYALSGKVDHLAASLIINMLLVFLFAAQHSIMARKRFKQLWTQVIPAHLERSTFVLSAGIAILLILWFWQPAPGVVWSIEQETVRVGILGLALFGVGYVVFTTFVTNHFELLGLRQAWLYAVGKPYTIIDFKRRWVYRYSRHPMMLGLLIVFWSTPDMTVDRLVLALLLTVYLFIGIRFEERSLIAEYGDSYKAYQKSVGMFFTWR